MTDLPPDEELRRLLRFMLPEDAPPPDDALLSRLRDVLYEQSLAPEEQALVESKDDDDEELDRPRLEELLELRVQRALATALEDLPDSSLTIPQVTVLRGSPDLTVAAGGEETRAQGPEMTEERAGVEATFAEAFEQLELTEGDIALTDGRLVGTLAQSVGVEPDAPEATLVENLPRNGALILTDDRGQDGLERSLSSVAATFHERSGEVTVPSGATASRLHVMNLTNSLGELEQVMLWSVPAEQRANLLKKARRMELVGELLGGKYRIKERLGQGGFGTVYRGYDEILKTDVAIKVLNPRFAKRRSALESFLAEAQRLTTVDHPNIVRWITFDRTPDGLHYFVMEFLRGEELHQLLKNQGALEPSRAASILLQILDALRRAHKGEDGSSLLHLDLKPQNVFILPETVNEPEKAKVIDFGISRYSKDEGLPSPTPSAGSGDLGSTSQQLGQTPQSGTVRRAAGGTVLYASPEQCKHISGDEDIEELDGCTDLYALGVMGFQMLTGMYPFPEPRTHLEAIRNHMVVPPFRVNEKRKDVPKDLAAFIDKCLVKDRNARWASTEEAYQALRRIVDPPLSKVKVLAAVAALVAVTAIAVGKMVGGDTQVVAELGAFAFSNVPRDPAASGGQVHLDAATGTAVEIRLEDPASDLAPTGDDVVVVATDTGTSLGESFSIDRVEGGFDLRCVGVSGLSADQLRNGVSATVAWDADGVRAQLPLVLQPVQAPAAIPEDNVSIRWSDGRVAAGTWRHGGKAVLKDDASLVVDLEGWRHLRSGETKLVLADGSSHVFNERGGYNLSLASLERPEGYVHVEVQNLFGHSAESAPIDLVLASDATKLVGRTCTVEWIPEGGEPASKGTALATDARSFRLLHRPDEAGRLVVEIDVESEGTPALGLTGARLESPRPGTLSEKSARFELDLSAEERSQPLSITLTASDETWLLSRSKQQSAYTIEVRFHEDAKVYAALEGGPTASVRVRPEEPAFIRPGKYELELRPDEEYEGNARWRVVTLLDGNVLEPAHWVNREDLQTGKSVATLDLASAEAGVHRVAIRMYPEETLAVEEERANAATLAEREATQEIAFEVVITPELTAVLANHLPLDGERWRDAFDTDSEEALLALERTSRAELADIWVETRREDKLLHADNGLDPGLTFADLFGETTRSLPDGDYEISVEARDVAGNPWSDGRAVFYVNARPPVVGDLLWPTMGGSWTVTDEDKFRVEVQATDPNGVDSVEATIAVKDSGAGERHVVLAPEQEGSFWAAELTGSLDWEGQTLVIQVTATDRDHTMPEPARFEVTVPSVPRPYPNRLRPQEGPATTSLVLFRPQGTYVFAENGANVRALTAALAKRGAHYVESPDVAHRELHLELEPLLETSIGTEGGELAFEPFYLDEHEVSRSQFLAFLDAADGYENPANWRAVERRGDASRMDALRGEFSTRVDQPALGVTWDEADAYARWAKKRLPTLLEWEYAVRGETGRLFAYTGAGETIQVPYFDEDGAFASKPGTVFAAVGLAGPLGVTEGPFLSPEGIYHLCGNAAEWTATPYLSPKDLAEVGARRRWILSVADADAEKPEAFWIAGRDYSVDARRKQNVTHVPPHDFKAARKYERDFCLGKVGPDRTLPLVGFRCALDAEETLREDSPWYHLSQPTVEAGAPADQSQAEQAAFPLEEDSK